MTNRDKVLKILLKIDTGGPVLYDPFPFILPACPELSKQEIEASLIEMESEKLLLRSQPFGMDSTVLLLPTAFNYFPNLKEVAAQKRADKWAERRWSLFMFSMGILATIFTMWVKSKFFP